VTAGAFGLVALLGIFGLAWSAGGLQQWFRAVHWRERRVEMVVLALAALWIANRSMDSPNTYYDTGMYHYPVVKWLTSYAIVPGLANLNGPLAFNNAHLLYAAMLDGALDPPDTSRRQWIAAWCCPAADHLGVFACSAHPLASGRASFSICSAPCPRSGSS
jgi:hypothetical protein